MKPRLFQLTAAMLLLCRVDAGDLAAEWQKLVDQAAEESKVLITRGHISTFGGVSTSIPILRLKDNANGDAADTLYQACGGKFTAWARENGASFSTAMGVGMMWRLKAKNGDYLGLIYREPTTEGSSGTLTIVFVDADVFAVSTGSVIKVSKPAESDKK